MRIQRLSASTFRIETPGGKVIILDPWLVDDPMWPLDERALTKLASTDIVAITHGHFDHFPGVFEVAKANSEVRVVAVFELAFHLAAQGIKNFRPIGVGGTIDVDGVKFTAVQCVHSSSLLDMATGTSQWVGPPVSYVIELEDGFKIYALGDTGLHADMKLIGDYHRPDLALVPISGSGFVMRPQDAVYAVTQLIKPRHVIPFHDFPQPANAANPAGLEEMLRFMPQSREGLSAADRFLKLMAEHPAYHVTYLAIGDSVTDAELA